jgi:hypothetical protein
MAYKGNIQSKASDIRRFYVTSSTSATHALTWTAPNEQSLIVTINGVKQHEDAYSVSGVTLTLTSALIATDKLEVIGINDIGTTITPAQGSVTNDMVSSSAAIAKTKLASLDIVNADVNASAAIATSKIAGLAASATTDTTNASNIASGTLGTARMGSGTASSSTFLRGDSSWAEAGGDNTPSFHASKSATQSLASGVWTKVQLDAEEWDSDSAFDSSTNYRFTVPSGEGGKYIFHFGSGIQMIDTDQYFQLGLYKNGSQFGTFQLQYSPTTNKTLYFNSSFSANLSATDYIELYAKQSNADPHDLLTAYTYLSGFKLVGV